MIDKKPKVAVCAILRRGDKVLLGKRCNSHSAGKWGFPGGHLEYKESFEDCAARELMEETGLKVENFKYGFITNSIFDKDDLHYITIYMVADYIEGEAEVLEPDKCTGWEWYSWNNLPENIFSPIVDLKKTDFNPSKI